MSRPFKSLSIRATLILVMMTTSALVLALGFGAIFVHDIAKARISMADSAHTLAQLLSENAGAALAFDDEKDSAKLLESLSADPHVLAAYVIRNDGTELASYRRAGTSVPQRWTDAEATSSHFEPEYLVVTQPVAHEGKLLGRVQLAVDRGREKARKNSLLSIGSIVVGVLMILAYFVSSRLQRPISRPVEHLVSIAREVSETKAYSIRAKKTTDNELGVLVDGFNTMLSKIQERDQSLANHRAHLEEEVERRTHELVVVNSSLREAKERAETAVRIKSQFLANMSHELRTPMHGILSFARFGLDKTGDTITPKVKRYFENIFQAGTSLLTLLNDLLDLSKLEAGKMIMQYETLDLSEITGAIHDEFGSVLSEKSVRLVFSGDAKRQVCADRDRLIQVIRNLVSNAVKVSPEDGTIEMRVEQQPDSYQVIVLDEGLGIPPSELEEVFEKFVQSSLTRSSAGGTGLGLAICQEIVVGHGGRIWAENRPEVGAAFYIELPVDPRPPEARNFTTRTPQSARAVPSAGKGPQ